MHIFSFPLGRASKRNLIGGTDRWTDGQSFFWGPFQRKRRSETRRGEGSDGDAHNKNEERQNRTGTVATAGKIFRAQVYWASPCKAQVYPSVSLAYW